MKILYLEFEDSNKMKEYLNILFKNGFVFGFQRLKTIEEVEKAFRNLYDVGFKYLVFGLSSRCSKVIEFRRFSCSYNEFTTIEEVLKLDY